MKILSLQSKIGLVVWSVVLAFIIQYIVYLFGINIDGYCLEGKICHIGEFVGWPIEANVSMVDNHYNQIWIENFVFWILVIFIVLLVIAKYPKNRKS